MAKEIKGMCVGGCVCVWGGVNLCSDTVEPRSHKHTHTHFLKNQKLKSFVLSPQRREKAMGFKKSDP